MCFWQNDWGLDPERKCKARISRIEVLGIVDTQYVLNLVRALQNFSCSAGTAVVSSLWVSWRGRSREAWATKLSSVGKSQETEWPFSPSHRRQTQVHTSVCLYVSGPVFLFPWVLSALSRPTGKPDIYPEFLREEPLGRSASVARVA